MPTETEKLQADLVLYARTGKVPQLLACLEAFTGDLNFKSGGRTLLGHAAAMGKEAAVQALIGKGARLTDAGSWGLTPLMLAAIKGSVACVEILTQAGADPEAKDIDDRIAADHAREAGHDEVVAILAGLSADPWGRADQTCLASLDEDLVAAATAFVRRALASGERGEVQSLSTTARFPFWYRQLLAGMPLAGISFVASPPCQTSDEEGRFLNSSGCETFANETPHLLEAILGCGLCPIAAGGDYNYWAIETEGGYASPVHLWDMSRMKADLAYDSFPALLGAARQSRGRNLN